MRFLIAGITGAMGKTLIDMLEEDVCVAGFARQKGQIGNIPVYDVLDDVTEELDCIIDFSHAACVSEVVMFAQKRKVPLVEATTGLEEQTIEIMRRASEDIPIVYSRNMSIGVHTMNAVVEMLTKILGGYDIEIIEKHHHHKKDAPSGTAKMFFDTIAKNRNVREIYDRSGKSQARKPEEVGISAVRGGTIVGEHTVLFAGTDEVLEIKHSAGSKKIFAGGALRAAKFLQRKEVGFFDMKEVLEESI